MEVVEKCLFLGDAYSISSDIVDERLRSLVESSCRCEWRNVLHEQSYGEKTYSSFRDGVSCDDVPDVVKLSVAVACLYKFVASQWSVFVEKPTVETASDELFIPKVDFEPLDVACSILDSLQISSARWWLLRVASVRLAVTEDVPQEQLASHLDQLNSAESAVDELCAKFAGDEQFKATLLLELATCYHRLGYVARCRELVKRAGDCIGLKFWLDGRMGKRTKFQADPKAQLVLNVEGGLQAPVDEVSTRLSELFTVSTILRGAPLRYTRGLSEPVLSRPISLV